ncbi:MAG: hypothetical protein K6U87_06120 [Firmicutes bacterium]|nr:hypothetical protein [Bacillota bacterium]
MAVMAVEIRDAEGPRGEILGYAVYDAVSGLVVSEAFADLAEAEAFRDWYADPGSLPVVRRAVTVADLMEAWEAARRGGGGRGGR